MRLVGYVRVSRVGGREGDTFISPTVQRERCEALARAHGHTIVAWQEDLDQPGSRYTRPGFQAALEAVERGEAEGMIVAALDRFARSVPDAALGIRRLEQAGGELISVRDSLDTSTPVGRFARTMMLAIAELQLEQIRENWQAARDNAIRRGVHISRVAPVGYRRGADSRLEPDPEAAPVIRDLFLRRAAGASWRDLMAMLDERLPREDGGSWPLSTVSSIIRSRAYLGEAHAGDVSNPDAHEPLVTRAEWEAAHRKKGLWPGRGRGSLLAGIARCAACDGALTSESDGARGYRNYGCRGRSAQGVCPAPTRISQSRLDAHVEEAFLARLDADPVVVSGSATTDAVTAALGALEAAERELVDYRDAELVSVIGRAVYVAGLAERAARVDRHRETLAAAQRAQVAAVPVRDMREAWPGMPLEQRRLLLAAAVDKVIVSRAQQPGRGSPAAERAVVVWRGESG